MKVGLSTSVIQGGRTGIGRYVLELTRALLDLPDGPELMLFVLEADRPLFSFAEGRVRLEIVPERYRAPLRDIAWHQSQLPARVRALGLEVLHVPSYRRMLWPRPCALVATIHDLAAFHVSRKYDGPRMLYGRWIARALARRQHEIIAPSASTAGDLVRFFGLPPERLSVIHHGVDHAHRSPGDDAEIARRYGLDRPFFLYVSRFEHPGKNHAALIEAFARFKKETGWPWLLVLAGSDWHGAAAIHAAAQASACAADIRIPGHVPDEHLFALYRAAGAAVHPSFYEGFGFPPLEAMACGCPVLATPCGALAEVVGAAGLIVDPHDSVALAAGLARLAQDEMLRENLREAGRRNARRFVWRECAQATLEVYRRARARLKD